MVMFENMTIAYPWTPVSTYANGIYSIDNALLDPQPSVKANLNAANRYCRIDLAEPRYVRQIALLYTDFQEGDEVRVIGSPLVDLLPPRIDTGYVKPIGQAAMRQPAGYRHIVFHLPCRLKWQHWYIEITPTGADLNRSIGRIFVADAFQFEYNPDFGATSWGYEEASDNNQLDSGAEVLVDHAAAPFMNFTASWGTQQEMDRDWPQIGRYQHTGEPLLVTRRPDPHPERHNGIYYGRLRLDPITAADYDMFEVQGRIRSMV